MAVVNLGSMPGSCFGERPSEVSLLEGGGMGQNVFSVEESYSSVLPVASGML